MTAKRIISGEVLNYRNGLGISEDYGTRFASASHFTLTMPLVVRGDDSSSANSIGSLAGASGQPYQVERYARTPAIQTKFATVLPKIIDLHP